MTTPVAASSIKKNGIEFRVNTNEHENGYVCTMHIPTDPSDYEHIGNIVHMFRSENLRTVMIHHKLLVSKWMNALSAEGYTIDFSGICWDEEA